MSERTPAAADADERDPFRVVYWSADYIDREIERLEQEYTRFRNHLLICHPAPPPRRVNRR